MEYYPSRVWTLGLHIQISGFLFIYSLGVFNTTSKNVSADLGWDDNETFFITFFSSIVAFGLFLGTLVSGKMMNYYGKRKSIMIADVIVIVSSILAITPFTITFGIGRLGSGFASGIFLPVSAIFVNEISPKELVSKLGPFINVIVDVGIIISYFFGLLLPTSDYNSNWLNNWWKFVFFFPALLALHQDRKSVV